MGRGDNEMWHQVARGNIQQISCISQTEQHSHFRLILICLGKVNCYNNYTYILVYTYEVRDSTHL